MDILKIPLIILFKEQNPYNILDEFYKNDLKKTNDFKTINKSTFIKLYSELEKDISKDEIDNLYSIVNQEMNKNKIEYRLQRSVFKLLVNYEDNMLEDYSYTARCKYKELLKWRMITLKLDPDMFICSFLAYKDILRGHNRKTFDWDTIIKSDNIRLHGMLDKGIAENHFHLKGSAPTFKLSWISLMNELETRNPAMMDMDKYRLESDKDGQVDINDLISVASIIRIILFKKLVNIDDETEIGLLLKRIILDKTMANKININNKLLSINRDKLDREVGALKYVYGSKIKYRGNYIRIDYALVKNIDKTSRGMRLFIGERWLLYNCFKEIYSNNKQSKLYKVEDLFYAYLIIKNRVRCEMIQANDKVGFSNFEDYQNRKTKYIRKNTILREAVEPSAIMTSIKRQNIVSLEARIVPGRSVITNLKYINRVDRNICNNIFNDANNYWMRQYNNDIEMLRNKKYNSEVTDLSPVETKLLYGYNSIKSINDYLKTKYFYVYHFPKVKDKTKLISYSKDNILYRCRHYNLRKTIKDWAVQIYNMRENNQIEASRVLGIDACSNEMAARPEVFAQAFRFLKEHLPAVDYLKKYKNEYSLQVLRATYHVGEDFLDVIDGLRAVDESINFLNLSYGDRLGHAVVLGIDIDEWYSINNYRVYLSKQDILDNIAWLIGKIKHYDIKISSACGTIDKLLSIYNKYYSELYIAKDKDYNPWCDEKKAMNKFQYASDKAVVPVDIYIKAWGLRGDNPDFYAGNSEIRELVTPWDRYSVRKKEYNGLVCELYYRYHYDASVRRKGNEKESFKIFPYMIEVIKEVQKNMQNSIKRRGIGIETNPSSNVLISTFKRYDKHPILNMYNNGLVGSDDEKDCPQLFVSINTDDQGVFDTLLENEYALMGIALEKVKDKEGKPVYNQANIYRWLNNIRQMGIEQSFRGPNNK